MQGHHLWLDCGQEQVRLTVVLSGAMEVRLFRGGFWEPPESAPESASESDLDAASKLVPEAALAAHRPSASEQALPMQVEEEEESLLVIAGLIRLRVQKDPVRLTFLDSAARPILQENGGLCYDGWQVGVDFQAHPEDRFYGLGEADQHQGTVGLEASGCRFVLWNKHLPGPARMVVPVVVSRRGYGLVIANDWPGEIDFTSTCPDKGGSWCYRGSGGQMAYLFLAGGDMYGVLQHYTALTGRPPIPPLWSFGLLQSKYGYRSGREVLQVARTFRKKGLPCDAIILDLYWFRLMGDLRFDAKAFPRAKQMIARLKRMGFRVILIEEPYLGVASRLFREADRRGYMASRPRAEGGGTWLLDWWHSDRVGLADFSNPAVQAWWAEQHQALIAMGIEGWWTDLNEPELHQPQMMHYAGPAQAVHNRLALGMIAAVAQAMRRFAPEMRPFIMSRSGWAGMQRYGAALWSGDVKNTWQALAQQLALGLSAGMAGISGWNSDIGGFTHSGVDTSPELFIRWFQFGVFTPILRPHGDQQAREPWAFGPAAEAIIAHLLALRYQLLPYTYTYAWIASKSGAPLMRPLVLEFPDDPRTFQVSDQYLWGRELLVAPVLAEGVRTRQLYLPAGEWVDFWTGRRYRGRRRVRVAAPLERIPLFVRAGAILPLGSAVAHTGQLRAADPLTLRYYPTEGESRFDLYEDDGLSRAYETGESVLTLLRGFMCGPQIEFTAGPPVGRLAAAKPPRPWHLWVQAKRPPLLVKMDGPDELEWRYDRNQGAVLITLKPCRSFSLHLLWDNAGAADNAASR